jgi:OCT family organic cation transporter-like MFS transporter 4/5
VGTEEESTIVSEWDLVCDRSWLTPLPMSSFMFGVMLGALVLGSLSDRIGRRKSTTLFLAAILFLNGMSAVAPMFSIYLAIKFATGFFTGGYIISIFVLGNELVGKW